MKRIMLSLLGFSIIGLIVYASYQVTIFFIQALQQLDASLATAIIGAMATVIGGVLVVIISQWQIRKRNVEDSHRAKKVAIYQGFLEIASRNLAGSNKNVAIKAPSEKELIKYMLNFKTELILWGSPKVIKAYLAFESSSTDKGSHTLIHVNNLYLAIREDIGLSNKRLTNNELIKMYLSDPSEIDKVVASSNKRNS